MSQIIRVYTTLYITDLNPIFKSINLNYINILFYYLSNYMPYNLKSDYKIVKRIGEGAFGKVYKGVHLKTKEPVDIKIEKICKKLSKTLSLASILHLIVCI